MEARTQLAALDNNQNVGRDQAKTSLDDLRFKSQYARHKHDFVAKKIYEEKSYEYVYDLMDQVRQSAFGKEFPPIPAYKRVSISRQTPKKKADVVGMLQSRMAKESGREDDE